MRVLVWGCGDYGHRILPQLIKMNNINIVGYVDSNPDLWGKNIGTFTIYKPGDIPQFNLDQVLIAVNSPSCVSDIKKQLINMNFPIEKIIDIFSDKDYFDLLIDQRINFIQGYANWIYSKNVMGAVAECGVFRGDSAKYINKYFYDRRLYLCDTFEGFDTNDLNDEIENNKGTFQNSRFVNQSYFSETSIDLVMSKMIKQENVVIKQGYFPETMKDVEDKFVFVNLDMDLYIPMLEGLRYFGGKMSKYGCILLHDYFSAEFKRVEMAVNDYEHEIGRELIKFPIGDGCSLAIIFI